MDGGLLKLSLGQERLSWDLLAGKERNTRITGGVEWQQQFPGQTQLTLAAEGYASQTRYTLGLEKMLREYDGGRHSLGVNFIGVHGREGVGNDNQLQFLWRYSFGTGQIQGGGASPLAALNVNAPRGLTMNGQTAPNRSGNLSLLDAVAQRPSYMPSHVVAKVDTTALPTRLILVDKTGLHAGSSVNAVTGDVTVPLGVAVTGIAGVTRNGGAFANTSQFLLSGNSLIIRPSQITRPALGVSDTYVVTINNSGGGTTLATIVVSHGSVRIDSIVITSSGADTTPPVTASAPAISTAATDTTVSVTQTINETGTGYYLVLPAASAVPTVATVKTGTSFAMTAGTPAIVNITGLSASTAYKYYFVAKDAANNDQAAVSAGLAITTTAAGVPTIVSPILQLVPGSSDAVGSWTIAGATSATSIRLADNYGMDTPTTISQIGASLDAGLTLTNNGGGSYTIKYDTSTGNWKVFAAGLAGPGEEIRLSIDNGMTWYVIRGT